MPLDVDVFAGFFFRMVMGVHCAGMREMVGVFIDYFSRSL